MAAGTVLSKKWRPPASLLAFIAWQLTAGGLLLLPLARSLEPNLPPLSLQHISSLAYLGVIGAAVTYFIWLRGVERTEPSTISTLGFLTPLTAVVIGWLALHQSLQRLARSLSGSHHVLAAGQDPASQAIQPARWILPKRRRAGELQHERTRVSSLGRPRRFGSMRFCISSLRARPSSRRFAPEVDRAGARRTHRAAGSADVVAS